MEWMRVDGWLLLQASMYFVILTCGLITSISTGLVRQDFGGTCVLYGNVNCTAANTTTVGCVVYGGATSNCVFIITVNLLISVLFGVFMCVYHLYYLIRSRTLIRIVFQLWLKVLLASSVISTLVTLVSACIVTVGLSKWCVGVESFVGQEESHASLCSITQSSNWLWYLSDNEQPVNANQYYDLYVTAEATCWIGTCLWLLQCIAYVRHLVKDRAMQRSFQDDLFTIDDLDTFN